MLIQSKSKKVFYILVLLLSISKPFQGYSSGEEYSTSAEDVDLGFPLKIVDIKKTRNALMSTTIEIPSDFDLKSDIAIGFGSFGTVIGLVHGPTGKKFALKVSTVRHSAWERSAREAYSPFREIESKLYLHKSLTSCYGAYVRKSLDGDPASFKVYTLYEQFDTDLGRVVVSQQVLSVAHYRRFLGSLLSGLSFLKSKGILHRDLKPGNIFVNSDCTLKIGDFGSSCCMGTEDVEDLRMTTFLYRDPPQYIRETIKKTFGTSEKFGPRFIEKIAPDASMDMWAVGCIFAELLARKPLFLGVDEEGEMIPKILEVLAKYTRMVGSENPVLHKKSKGNSLLWQFLQLCSEWEKSVEGRSNFYNDFWKDRYPDEKVEEGVISEFDLAYDLFVRMLQPAKAYRIDVETASIHPFFTEFSEDFSETSVSSKSLHALTMSRVTLPIPAKARFSELFNLEDGTNRISISKITAFFKKADYALNLNSIDL